MKSLPHIPGFIHFFAFVLALPATVLVVGRAGEDAPGVITMVVCMVFYGIFGLALDSLRRRLQNRRYKEKDFSDPLA